MAGIYLTNYTVKRLKVVTVIKDIIVTLSDRENVEELKRDDFYLKRALSKIDQKIDGHTVEHIEVIKLIGERSY